MITRIVKLTFKPEEVDTFKTLFLSQKDKIRAVEGCCQLRLLNDINTPNIFFTYSYWENESDLEAYRHSELFKGIWAETKVLFGGKPEAWSVNELHKLD